MRSSTPYQIVVFFDMQPRHGDKVYQGDRGWLPQVTLKRRFELTGISEQEMLAGVKTLATQTKPFSIRFLQETQPDHMPVKVIEVDLAKDLMDFHHRIFKHFGQQIISKFSEREGENFYPHMTISWQGKQVVDSQAFADKNYTIQKIWVIKDASDDSTALASFSLGRK